MGTLKRYNGTDWEVVGTNVAGDALPVGTILPFSGSTIPNNYLLADGSAIPRTMYSELFAIIGTTYGSGDGSTTFNIPDLRGKVLVGIDANDTDFDTLGETGGEKTHTLTVQELPAHKHSLNFYQTGSGGNAKGTPYNAINNTLVGGDNVPVNNTGEDKPHNNLQPYIVQNYIIKVKMGSSLVGQVTDMYSSSTLDTYSCNYINNVKADSLPINAVVDYDGSTVPDGYELVEQVVTDGSAVKTGRLIDGHEEYVKRMELTNLPGNNSYKDYETGISMTNIVVTEMKTMFKSEVGNWFPVPNNDAVNSKIQLNSDGKVRFTAYTPNFGSNGIMYIEIFYFYTS